MPTVPGRVHGPASIGIPAGVKVAAVRAGSPQPRPAGVAARTAGLASVLQVVEPGAASSAPPPSSSAIISPLPGLTARASGVLASAASSGLRADQACPPSLVWISGE